MKNLVFLLSLIMIFPIAYAQSEYENDEIKTIFSKRISNGGYGAFSVGYSNIGGRDALVSGGRGAFIFDHTLAIGAGGYGFVNNLDYNTSHRDHEYSLAGGYGGLLIEPIIVGKYPVHASFPILIGMGGVSLFEDSGWDYWNPNPSYISFGNDVFFVLEPGAELEFNLARFFRLAIAVSYRYTSEIELFDIDRDALRGFNYGVTFKFGKF
jgi:hypothetical protein